MNELTYTRGGVCQDPKSFSHLYGGSNEVAGGEKAADDSSVIPAHP